MYAAQTAVLTNVSSSATNVTLSATNGQRLGWFLYNDSTSPLDVKFGVTASATSFTVRIAAGGYYEMPWDHVYQGQIDGIWDAANGNARITELIT